MFADGRAILFQRDKENKNSTLIILNIEHLTPTHLRNSFYEDGLNLHAQKVQYDPSRWGCRLIC